MNRRLSGPDQPEGWLRASLSGLALVAGLVMFVWLVLAGSGCSDWHHDPAKRAACVVRVVGQVGDPGRAKAREWARLGLGLCRDWNGRP